MGNEPEREPRAGSDALERASTKAIRGALLGLGAALPLVALLYGYTVDDALITARVASHWANGEGYRFNSYGPPVDAVTPLGFAPLLALGGRGSPLEMFERARLLGVASWLAGSLLLGALLARSASLRERLPVLLVVAVSAPLGAWASSGMETGFVTLLGCCALVGGAPGALGAGLAAGLRPELLPWAFVLSVGRSAFTSRSPEPRTVALSVALSLGPAVAVGLVRLRRIRFCGAARSSRSPPIFPTDFATPRARSCSAACRCSSSLRALSLAATPRHACWCSRPAHISGLSSSRAAIGWRCFACSSRCCPQPRSRRPVSRADRAAFAIALRSVLAVAASLFVLVDTGLPARHVLGHRLALIEQASPALLGARSVAALDAGWVGVAAPQTIVDLAGVTDPVIAALPGGHTSKRIPDQLLVGRGTDAWVLLLAPDAAPDADWRKFELRARGRAALGRPAYCCRFQTERGLTAGRDTAAVHRRQALVCRP